MSGDSVNYWQRRFVQEFLPEHEEELGLLLSDPDERVHSHRFRSSLANMVFYENPDLLPEISRELKHASAQMTFQAYIQGDLETLGILEQVQSEHVFEAYWEQIRGGSRFGGNVAKRIRRDTEEFSKSSGTPIADSLESDLRDFIEDLPITSVTPNAWGTCFFQAIDSKCNDDKGVLRVHLRVPDTTRVTPALCVTCPNLLVTDRNLPYLKASENEWRRMQKDAISNGDRERAQMYEQTANDFRRAWQSLEEPHDQEIEQGTTEQAGQEERFS